MRSDLWHKACLFGFVLSIAGAYPLADIANGQIWVGQQQLGFWVVMQFILAAIFMLGAWQTTPPRPDSNSLRWLLVAGVLARVLLLPVDSYTSNDSDRYLWDGAVTFHGHDPYRTSADDPIVADLRQIWPTPPEHAKYPTLYPPLAVAGFAMIAATGPENAPLLWKALVTIAGLLTLFLANRVLALAGQSRHLALVALSPLLILETGVGAHLDALTALAVTAAIYAWQRDKLVIAGACIGVGALLKLLPVFLLPPLLFILRRRFSLVLVGAAIVIIVGYGLALLAGLLPIGVLTTFFEKWRFGSPLFDALNTLFDGKALIAVIAFVAAVTGLVSCLLAQHKPLTGLLLCLSVPLLFSPVVFPWYLMSLVPLIALTPNAFWLVWTILLPMTYEVIGGFIAEGIWLPADWPLQLLAIGWVLAIGYQLLRQLQWPNVKQQPDFPGP